MRTSRKPGADLGLRLRGRWTVTQSLAASWLPTKGFDGGMHLKDDGTTSKRRTVRLGRNKALLCTIMMVLALSACGATDTDAAAGDLEEVKVTTFPTSVYLNVWVAMEQGFDEDRGLRLTEIATPGGASLYTPLVGGQADAAEILPALTLQYADQGAVGRGTGDMAVLPVQPVQANEAHPATAVVVRDGIDDVSDLIGKTIATHNEVSGFYTLARATLANRGVEIDNNDPEAAHSTVLPMGQMANALRLGQIDAGVMDYYSAMATEADGAGRILLPVMGAEEWDNYPYSLWAFNREFFDEQPDTVTRFLVMLLDANNWILNNPDDAKSLLVEKMGTRPELADSFIADFPLDGFTRDLRVNLEETPVPKLYDLLLEMDIVKERKQLDEIFEADDLIADAQSQWEDENPN